MTKAKPRRRYRRREVRPDGWFGSITIGQIKQWLSVVLPLVAALWLFAAPYVDAKAEQLLKDKLIQIGMDPATVQSLNKNLMELQQTVKEKDGAVDKLSGDVGDLKVELGKVLILLQNQQQILNAPAAEKVK